MNRTFVNRKFVLVGVAAAVLAIGSALAQSTGPAGRRSVPRLSPEQKCTERYAHVVGHLAYLGARLELTAEQQPLWDKWSQAMTAGAAKNRDVCRQDASTAGQPRTAVDRLAHYEQVLATKAESLKAAQPALETLYKSLTPEQKAVLDRPMGGRRHGRWGGGGRGGENNQNRQ
ncbi:MAG TPA: Spy/CpxP family protein refolding chaperone [Alphaproteobacteria bacterium]|nr:Spy/CpxP family protein refolding chaperone [Alphaproteobacteria bacterium]